MSGERPKPKFERCISTIVDIPRPALDNEEAPRSPEQSQIQEQEAPEQSQVQDQEHEEPPIITPSKQTALELADEMIADCERSLLNMSNIVRAMATDDYNIQSRRLMECSLEMYKIHRQTLDRDLANIFAIARSAAKYAER